MKKWLDRYESGGLVSKNSLNRTVTCSNCGWSWKLSDGGEDPLTCHKCGGTIKMENGGVIEDDMGQWAHPGQVTKINSNEITMQGVPYPVLGVDDTGYAQMMQPEMDYTFPGQYVTEYPMMQYGGLTKYKEKGEVKNTKTTPVVKKPVYQYTPQNFVQPSFNNIPYNVSYAEVPFINTDDIKGQIYANNQSKRGLEFHKKWMSSPMYKQMLYNSDPVNAKAIEKNRWDNYNKVKLTYDPVQPHDHPLWGASSNSTTGKIQFYPRGVEENVSNTGPHEISHSIDIDETGKNKKRNLPGKDMLKMYLYSNAVKTKQGTSNPLAEWKYKNNPSFYNYVAKPTETRARLSDIRQKAYENKLYDPFTQKVDANIFNKLLKFEFEKDKNWSPLYQLQNVYTNDQIIDLLNTVSKNDNNNLNTENANVDGMFAKNGGEMFNYKSGGQHGGLDRWFAEKWVDIKTGKPCGRQEGEDRNYPACRPSKRISSATPKTASELSSSEKQKFKQEKTSSQRISYNHKRMEYGGENINNMNYMKSGGNVPTNPELWSRAKAAAKSKYDVYPSAYANGFAAKWYKSHGGGWRKAAYGMEVMGNGGVPNNPGFNALPEYVQQNIINNMAVGGQKMPPKLAYARFAAAGNLDQLGRYGYQDGGEEEVYWRTKKPMVNDPSMDAISKVLLQRNQDKNFMQRAAGLGNQNGIPTRYIDGENPNSNDMSTLLMGFDNNYVSPTIIETFSNPLRNNSTMLRTAPGQLIYQPDQMEEYIKTPTVDIADYFAAKGYKRAANDMYSMNYKNGGNISMYNNGGEPDGEMALGQIDAAINKLTNLRKFIQPNSDLEPWVSSKLTMVDDYANSVSDYMMYNPETKKMMELPIEEMEYGGIPERYRNMGFTKVGAKKQSTRPGKKWMVLAKKGDQYKVVHGGYKGMQDFKQHHSEQRKENFWSRMGGRNSSKATDPFSPLYWHKRFGTWEYGGQPMAVGGQNVMNPIVKKDNRNWLEYLKN